MRAVIDRLARVPLAAVGFLILLSAAMAAGHVLLLEQIRASGGEELPQWVARLTIETYWGLLPLAFLMLWARRGKRGGLLGRIGAALLACGPVTALLIAVGALVWGGILGRGDLPPSVMTVESLFYAMMLGVVVCGVAFLLDAGVRWWGAMLLIGLLGDFVMPMALAAVYAVFGIMLVVGAARAGRRSTDVETALDAAH
ncbi:hypothetical protein [Microtetraspora niveoalba]|uniref:hypothetical protein n=1 Tax=Microtetraspora niveoalba TaxID=46175 RepID=UPI000829E038|nr:hypothetical protein [Microtetraspora niveoalba]